MNRRPSGVPDSELLLDEAAGESPLRRTRSTSTLVSMLMGKTWPRAGAASDGGCSISGVGAPLLHDIGKLDLPAASRPPRKSISPPAKQSSTKRTSRMGVSHA